MVKEVPVKKMYRGMVEVRDYDVKYCIDNKIPMKIKHGVDYMTLSPDEVETKIVTISDRTFPSQFKGRPPYKLCSYEFIPDKVEL